MSSRRDVLIVVAARRGSQGLPGKNVRPMCGKPLIAWTIEAGQAAACASRVLVTTDDKEIAAEAARAGADVPFLRPAHLAASSTPGVEPVIHLVQTVDAPEAFVCLLQPTSPLRTSQDIDAARAMITDDVDAVIGVTEVRQHALWQQRVGPAGFIEKVFGEPPSTRQALGETRYCPNGAVYLCRTHVLLEQRTLTPLRTAAYVMPGSRSVDIDTLDDFNMAECLLAAGLGR